MTPRVFEYMRQKYQRVDKIPVIKVYEDHYNKHLHNIFWGKPYEPHSIIHNTPYKEFLNRYFKQIYCII